MTVYLLFFRESMIQLELGPSDRLTMGMCITYILKVGLKSLEKMHGTPPPPHTQISWGKACPVFTTHNKDNEIK